MKQLISTLIIITLTTGLIAAQESGFGIKGGINLSTYKISSGGITSTPDRAIKPRIGLFYNHLINDQWAIQFEALYSGTGYKPEGGSFVHKVSMNYLAFPMMFKYYLGDKFNFHVGPELAFFIGGKSDDVNVEVKAKTVNLGLGIGAEVSLSSSLRLGARYTFGLTNTDNSDADLTQKSNNIEIALLVRF